MFSQPPHNKLLVIVGETASGKSALALHLAREFDGEIVSADAWTVYRGFDIGTAKPSSAEQAIVPHHLIDIAEPADGFSAAVFKRLATPVIAAIQARGKLPILVGGSGLYIDSVLYDYSFLERTDPAVRTKLDVLSLKEVQLLAAQKGLDTSGIDIQNKRRVIRLIENNGVMPTRAGILPGAVVIGIQPPRLELNVRIQARVDAMLAAGLEDEVRALSGRHGWEVEAMKGVGYREFRDYFSGIATIADVRERIIRSTTQLAKKQRTWFGRNKSIHWFITPVNYITVVDFLTTALNK
jgi:tRNA dimethylallyltransferase